MTVGRSGVGGPLLATLIMQAVLAAGASVAFAQGGAEQWSRVLALGDTADARSRARDQLMTVLAQADSVSDGRVLVQAPGTPDETLVGLIAQVFDPMPRLVEAGHTVERIVTEQCGHVSPTYVQKLTAANGVAISAGKVAGSRPGEPVNIVFPACLKTKNTLIYRVESATPATWAMPVSGRQYGTAYCDELKQLNFTDVCALSQRGGLRVGTLLRLPKPADQHATATSSATLTASRDAAAPTQELATKLLTTYQNANVVGTLTQPTPVAVDPRPANIVPLKEQECAAARPPFDPRGLAESILEFQRHSKGKVAGQSRVVVGIVDTGLYDLARTSFFERLPPTAGPGGAGTSFSRIEVVSGVPMGRTFPGEIRDVSPDNGTFADHGTHVAGLVIGGADFWDFVSTATFTEPQGRQFLASYVPSLIPIKVMISPGAGLAPRTTTGDISSALSYLRNEVSIVNLSYTARIERGLADSFANLKANNKVLIVSAAGNDFHTNGGLDDVVDGEQILPAMLTGPNEKLFLTVGALDASEKGKPAYFSQRSRHYVDLFAPGTCIRSFGANQPLQGDVIYSGTSQAAPLVSFTAALLRRFNVPLERLKDRIMDTVDASDHLSDHSISGGRLNPFKALNYLDDIVVLRSDPPGTFRRGTIVALDANGNELLPGFIPKLCRDGSDNDPATLRNARRIVVGRDGDFVATDEVRWAKKKTPLFYYNTCKPNTEQSYRIKGNDGKGNAEFTLATAREIVPKPEWQ
jgi:subtilisin family serine protease